MGPVIDDAVDRDGIDVLNAERKIALAGHRHDAVGFEQGHFLSRERPAVDHLDFKAQFFPLGDELAYGALAAAHAVVDVGGELPVANINLEAVWKQHENTLALYPAFLRLGEGIVDFYE